MSLYHKYRPQTFADMAGNVDAIASITRELAKPEGKRAQYYLLTGLSGGGKSTAAGIIKRMLEVNPMNLVEINAANCNKVDDARELVGQLRLAPLGGGKRLFHLEEAHRLTPAFWDIMLDPLENLPEGTYFIVSTSEAHKVPKAAFNRAFHFQVNPLTPKECTRLLDKICQAEGLDVPDAHLDVIVEAAGGSSRMAIQLLEKSIGAKNLDAVKKLCASPVPDDDEKGEIAELAKAIMAGKPFKECAAILNKLKGEEPEGVRRGVAGYLAAVACNKGDRGLAECAGQWAIQPTYEGGFATLVGLVAASTGK